MASGERRGVSGSGPRPRPGHSRAPRVSRRKTDGEPARTQRDPEGSEHGLFRVCAAGRMLDEGAWPRRRWGGLS